MQNLLARTSDYGPGRPPGRAARYAQVIYLTARPATPVVTRAVNVLPAPLAPRVVVRDLPEGADLVSVWSWLRLTAALWLHPQRLQSWSAG